VLRGATLPTIQLIQEGQIKKEEEKANKSTISSFSLFCLVSYSMVTANGLLRVCACVCAPFSSDSIKEYLDVIYLAS
jgi:hypothetical protein